jgi:hypothetical protein
MATTVQDALAKAGADDLSGFCPPRQWEREHICDVQILNYSYNMRVDNQLVECTLRYRIERCTEDYVLSDLVHSITLFPGEEVFLSTRTKHSVARFTDDSSISASQASRSSDRVWMESFKAAATNFSETSAGTSNSSSHSEYSTTSFGGSAGVNLLFFNIGGSAAHASGEFDASSSSSFFNQLNQHLSSTAHQTNQVTRDAMSVSMSQVNSHRVATAETREELEVSTRRFRNDNECHTVTHYFYQIAKRQRVKITLEGRSCRPLNTFADTAVRAKPLQLSIASNAKPNYEATAAGNPALVRGNLLLTQNVSADQVNLQRAASVPFSAFQEDEKARLAALAKVEAILAKQSTEFSFESVDIIPTEALFVESELGSCMICEPYLVAKQQYELEHLRLENVKLQKEIDLLEKFKDYRCCDDDDENVTSGASDQPHGKKG